MALKSKSVDESVEPLSIPPPIDEAGWQRLEAMPGVIVRRRDPRKTKWTFRSDIHLRPGYDLSRALEQDDDIP